MNAAALALAGTLAVSWTPIKTVDGIQISKGRVAGDPVLAFKGEGDVDAPLPVVATAIFDTTRATEWIDSLKECRLQRWLNDLEYVEYDHVGTPPLIADRDFVSIVKLGFDPKARTVDFTYRNAEDPSLPLIKKFVRGDLKSTTFHLTAVSPNRTHVVGEVHVDPRGLLPKWLVNWVQADWPELTFKGLRRQVAKPDVRADEKFLKSLAW
jgi:hypothetical protein